MLTRRNELRSRPAAMPVAALLNMLLGQAVERPSLGQKSIFEIHQIFGGGGGGGGKVVSGQRMRKPDSFDLPSNLVSGNTPLWSWPPLTIRDGDSLHQQHLAGVVQAKLP
ncbi:hypothetical protein CIHG_08082 [Coccidioides immitis H538.4]|uniref:Uncharacterized protein n=3 Tax=Coccidioides immitis TaxID=5501 RepID=A0A0J8TYR9_COCIT|nr:hypothetical protein CIRG_01999 [Coccidioides immitis RMSCC 2394]KMU79107.1 hypothetical protein CISG_07273 [Coccidioides immitis RMSCC 3703]KMU90273.1 hypothetical protein CIHG_08082 [Coccidioides immitis H538.4]